MNTCTINSELLTISVSHLNILGTFGKSNEILTIQNYSLSLRTHIKHCTVNKAGICNAGLENRK